MREPWLVSPAGARCGTWHSAVAESETISMEYSSYVVYVYILYAGLQSQSNAGKGPLNGYFS